MDQLCVAAAVFPRHELNLRTEFYGNSGRERRSLQVRIAPCLRICIDYCNSFCLVVSLVTYTVGSNIVFISVAAVSRSCDLLCMWAAKPIPNSPD